jgi:hypothetical protein
MKLRVTAAAVALSALASVAQAEVVAPSFTDSAPVESAPNVSDTVIVKQIPQPSFQDASNVAYGVVIDSTVYQGTAY